MAQTYLVLHDDLIDEFQAPLEALGVVFRPFSDAISASDYLAGGFDSDKTVEVLSALSSAHPRSWALIPSISMVAAIAAGQNALFEINFTAD